MHTYKKFVLSTKLLSGELSMNHNENSIFGTHLCVSNYVLVVNWASFDGLKRR